MNNKENKKIVLVTGSAGFIGFHTTYKLLKLGYTVIGIDNLNNYYDPKLKIDRNKILKENPDYNFELCELSNKNQVDLIFDKYKVEKVIHLAAQAGVRYSLENPHSYIDSNVTGYLNVLESMRSHHVEKIVYASSSSVYGGNKNSPNKESDEVNNPLSIYATTKRMNELMAYNYHSLYGFKCLGLRFFTVYGEFGRPDMALYNFTKNIVENKTIRLFNNGKMKRSFTHVDDVVNGIISALNADFDYEVFNIGNGSSVELLEFVEMIENSLNMKARIEYLPLQQGDALNTFADINKSKELLNFIPKIDLADGVNRFVEWYKGYYKCV